MGFKIVMYSFNSWKYMQKVLSACDIEHLRIVNVAKLSCKWGGHKLEHRLDHEDFKIQ